MANYKKERLEKAIERELGNILLLEVKDDRLKYVIINTVRLSNDLMVATVFYSILGDENQVKATTDVLIEAQGYIRSMLGKRVQMSKIPELRFKYATSSIDGYKIEEILKGLNIPKDEE